MIVQNSLSAYSVSMPANQASVSQSSLGKVDSASPASQFSEDAVVLSLSERAHTFNIGDGWSVKLDRMNVVEEIDDLGGFGQMNFVI